MPSQPLTLGLTKNLTRSIYGDEGEVPTQIAGLGLWLDASDASTITLNGTDVSEWRDKSGNGRDFNQGTAIYQPLYSIAAQNGKNAIYFTGNNSEYLSGNTAARQVLSGLSGSSVFIVYNISETNGTSGYSGGNAIFYSTGASTTTGLFSSWHYNAGFGPYGMRRRVSSDGGNSNRPLGAGWGVLTSTIDYSVPVHKLYGNNVLGTSSGSGLTAGTTNTETAQRFYLGGSGSAGGWATGYIAEVLFYSRVLTDTERNTVANYLKAKWGTP